MTLGFKISPSVPLAEAVDIAVRKIVRADHRQGGSHVTMPIRYPSGASAVLEITQTGDRCFINDMGLGFLEAEMIGATRQYERHARIIAEDTGIRYDGRSFFVAEVPTKKLAGAMTLVADSSHRCASFAALKAAERAETDIRQNVFDRMISLFGADHVRRDSPFIGASGHEWKVPFLIDLDHGRAVIEAISPHSGSIAFTVMRLSDISRLETPPPRLVVVNDKRKLGDMLGVVSPVSTAVIDISESKRHFEKFLLVA
ncbi:hypothetical protein [Methylobacterium sp. Leaf399]|uniref:hypothetical protein n=1 Tax=Methylobacterium sp. Leaf399 TaxID=1736364 RepID=UPI000B28EEF3|nr:hypothetical protein [Methylobacterium sp. Leaf399]